MNRGRLDALLGRVREISGEHVFTMIGSQAVHAATDDVPAEVLVSREVDLLIEHHDPISSEIDRELGPTSRYAVDHLVHVDTVNPSFPYLPEGYEARLVPLTDAIRCLEIHDLVLSKLMAGRLKDYELIAVLFDRGLASIDTARDRIATISDLHTRAMLLARLQIVVESAGR